MASAQNTPRPRRYALAVALVAAGLTSLAAPAQAALTLNAAGIAAGFSLSTFYSDPTAYYGTVSNVGVGGVVFGSGYARGQIYKFADVDGQSFGSALLSAPAGGSPTGIAAVGGVAYVGVLGGLYYAINPTTLALTAIPTTGIAARYGLWGNEKTGHLLAGTNLGLVDIDPASGARTLIGSPGGNIDGVTVSPDGSVAYIETNSSAIFGYSLTSVNPTAPVFSRTGLPGGPDGTGIVNGGAFSGDIIVNNNDGTIGLINHLTGVETIIASGGARGDLVGPDLNNGTLFLSMQDATYRLACGEGCTIGSAVPEPTTVSLLAMGLVALGWRGRKRLSAAG